MNNTTRITALTALIIGFCVSGSVFAQNPGVPAGDTPQVFGSESAYDAPPAQPGWGTTDRIAYVVPGYTFNNYGDTQHARTFEAYIYRSAGLGYWDQTIYLPSGALIDGVTTFYDDNDSSANVNFDFYHLSGRPTTGLSSTELLADTSSGSSGFQGQYDALPGGPHTVRNYNPDTLETSFYLLVVGMSPSGADDDLAFGGAVIWYKLQVSPAPAVASFNDVDTNYWAFQAIEALASSGITTGYADGTFRPENTVTRAQMATFLSRALGLYWSDGFLP